MAGVAGISANRLELLQIADAVAREKTIDRKIVIQAIEDAIQKAAKSRYGAENDIRCEINPKTGETKLTRVLTVVETVENDSTQITLADAQRRKRDAALGDEIVEALPPLDFGRVAAQVGRDRLLVVRVQRLDHERAALVVEPARHQHRFGRRRRAVVHRRVGDLETEQLGDDRLVLEDRLQRALRDLGLVRRVARVPLGAREQRVDRRRDRVRSDAATDERDRAVRGRRRPAVVRDRAQVVEQRSLVERLDVELPLGAQSLGDVLEQRSEAGLADDAQHARDVSVGVRQIPHAFSCSFKYAT